jgi:hypothetical protein
MFVPELQLNKFILDSNLVSRADLDKATEEAEKKGVKTAEVVDGE